LKAQRALIALQLSNPEIFPQAIMAIFTAMWVERKQIGDAESLKAILAEKFGEAVADKALQATQEKSVKDGLTKNTQIAFDVGAFGLPWFEGMHVVYSLCSS
jgi:2-hydroxychromene-2-carboxylate isomerase